MGLTDLAQRHAQRFMNNGNHWGVTVNLSTPDGTTAIVLGGFHVKHNTGFDLDGVRVNSKNASIAISELDLMELNYPYRIDDEIVLQDHLVTAADVTGIIKNYIVRQNYPDEKLGCIVLILGDIETF